MRRLIEAGLALGYAGLIFFLSSQSSFPVPAGIWDFDKLLHCAEYAILAVLIARAARPSTPGRLALTALLASLYGLSDELHQHFVPGRCADKYDLLADAAGSVLGVLVFRLHSRRKPGGSRAT